MKAVKNITVQMETKLYNKLERIARMKKKRKPAVVRDMIENWHEVSEDWRIKEFVRSDVAGKEK